jgi:hypothetical protein
MQHLQGRKSDAAHQATDSGGGRLSRVHNDPRFTGGIMTQPIPTANAALALAQQKSVGVAVLLAIFFGPLGMLYSTIVGAIVMFFVTLVVGIISLGLGLILCWPVCVVWAALAAQSHNRKMMGLAIN